MTSGDLKSAIIPGITVLGIILMVGMGAGTPAETSADPERLVAANTAFGLRLFRELAMAAPAHNILISPTGLGMALALAYDGAAGVTAREMAEVLRLKDLDRAEVDRSYALLMDALLTDRPHVRLDIANSIWADEATPFREEFLQTGRASYGAAIKNLDFSAPEAPVRINAWITDATAGKIGAVIAKIDPDVVLYLINAVYFKGRWAVPFDSAYTSPRQFTLADGRTKTVPVMVTQLEKGAYYMGENFSAACLDYGDGRTSMYLFLPDQASGLDELLGKLDQKNLAGWLAGFETGPCLILLPRFQVHYDAILNDALKSLGMRSAFAGADFSRMTPERVFISMVRHTAIVEVDEEGTEAAASAVIEFKKGPGVHLAFLRPFVFAIIDNPTGAILFVGTVAEP
jgi:serine protease inhibitor